MMGSSHSSDNSYQYKIPTTPKNLPYFFMSFLPPRKIQILHMTEGILNIIRTVGGAGIATEESKNDQLFIFSLKGEPFNPNQSENFAVKHLLCDLLAYFYQNGWDLALSSDFAQRASSASISTWFFRKVRSGGRSEGVLRIPAISCLYLSSPNFLELINVPEIIFSHCLEAAKYLEAKGSKRNEKDFEIALRGSPWFPKRTNEAICAKLTILEVWRVFARNGFRFVGCGNYKGLMDAMFFQSDPTPKTLQAGESAMLTLQDHNKLWLLQCPSEIVQLIEQACIDSWNAGVDYHVDSGACYQIKLNQSPWDDNFSLESPIQARFLLIVIFQRLRAAGWTLENVLHLSLRPEDKALFILKPENPKSVRYLCICPQGTSRICLINGEPSHNQVFGAMLKHYWPPGVKTEGLANGCYQWKLNGSPWHPTAENVQIVVKHLMCMLLAELSVIGWHVVCSADISLKYTKNRDLSVQSWFVALE